MWMEVRGSIHIFAFNLLNGYLNCPLLYQWHPQYYDYFYTVIILTHFLLILGGRGVHPQLFFKIKNSERFHWHIIDNFGHSPT
jgi:hypothetical protein